MYPVIDIELSYFLDVDTASFLVDAFEGIVHLVVHGSHSV